MQIKITHLPITLESMCLCVGGLTFTVFLLMNTPVMQNSVYPHCYWLHGCHGNTLSRINDITATCH